MEAIFSSETSVDFQRTTRRYMPEDNTLQTTYTIYIVIKRSIVITFRNIAFPVTYNEPVITHPDLKWHYTYYWTCNVFYYRRVVYGFNNIPIEVQSLFKLFLLEVINPFYIFQLFTLCVWAAEGYHYYLIAIVLMTSFGVISTIIQTRKVSVTKGGIQDLNFILSNVFVMLMIHIHWNCQ
jgi:hypothetical protein